MGIVFSTAASVMIWLLCCSRLLDHADSRSNVPSVSTGWPIRSAALTGASAATAPELSSLQLCCTRRVIRTAGHALTGGCLRSNAEKYVQGGPGFILFHAFASERACALCGAHGAPGQRCDSGACHAKQRPAGPQPVPRRTRDRWRRPWRHARRPTPELLRACGRTRTARRRSGRAS